MFSRHLTQFSLWPVCAAAILIAHPGTAASQARDDSLPPVSFPCSHAHQLVSRINGQSYPLNVVLPPQYCARPRDTTKYAVLYLLDDGVKSAGPAERYRRGSSGAPGGLIIVGIGWPPNPSGTPGVGLSHSVDYLTAAKLEYQDSASSPRILHEYARAQTARVRDKVMMGVKGRADVFLRVMREEIIPLIDRTYRTTSERGLFGHSNGGFFALYTMFEAPGLFNKIAAGSPALWWNDYWIFQREAEFAKGHRSLPVELLLMASDEEFSVTQADVLELNAILDLRDYQGLKLRIANSHGGHNSVDDIRQALDILYPLFQR